MGTALESAILITISGALGAILTQLALIDLRTFRLPDLYTLPLILAGLALNGILAADLPHDAIWGALSGYCVFWAIGTAAYRRTGIETLGLGDAKLFAAAGAWVGFGLLPLVLLLAAGGALLRALARGRTAAAQPIAFGPWLAVAFWATWTTKTFALPL